MIYWVLRGSANDDAFITYRYAYNLATGQGFVYNVGERVLGTTTPLLTLLLGVLGLAWQGLLRLSSIWAPAVSLRWPDLLAFMPEAAAWIGATSLAVGGWLLGKLGESQAATEGVAPNSPEGEFSLVVWAVKWAGYLLYPTFPLLLGTMGMEMPLYLVFCLGAVAAFGRSRYLLAAVCAALAFLTRPDGLLLAALLAVAGAWRWRSQTTYLKMLSQWQPGGADALGFFRNFPWQPAGVFLALALPWLIFAWLYFGSPVPVTLVAKQNQGAMSFAADYHYLARALAFGRGYFANFWWFPPQLVLFGLGWGSSLWPRKQPAWGWGREQAFQLVIAWAILFALSYQLLGVSAYYWYYAPLIPAWVLGVAGGVALLAGWLTRGQDGRLASGLALGLLLILAFGQVQTRIMDRPPENPQYTAYREIGCWLRENTPPTARVGALEIGLIGYYSQRPIVDFAGLVQPQNSAWLRQASGWEPAILAALDTYRPAYVVMVGEYAAWREEEGFTQCSLLRSIPSPTSFTLYLYECPIP